MGVGRHGRGRGRGKKRKGKIEWGKEISGVWGEDEEVEEREEEKVKRRRDLKKGDEIGFHWDPYNCVFNFCVLKRAMPEN